MWVDRDELVRASVDGNAPRRVLSQLRSLRYELVADRNAYYIVGNGAWANDPYAADTRVYRVRPRGWTSQGHRGGEWQRRGERPHAGRRVSVLGGLANRRQYWPVVYRAPVEERRDPNQLGVPAGTRADLQNAAASWRRLFQRVFDEQPDEGAQGGRPGEHAVRPTGGRANAHLLRGRWRQLLSRSGWTCSSSAWALEYIGELARSAWPRVARKTDNRGSCPRPFPILPPFSSSFPKTASASSSA